MDLLKIGFHIDNKTKPHIYMKYINNLQFSTPIFYTLGIFYNVIFPFTSPLFWIDYTLPHE